MHTLKQYMAHRGTLLDELYRRATEKDGKTKHAHVLFNQEVSEVVSDMTWRAMP